MVFHILKIILIGDARVGKTSIRKRYFGENFQANYMVTMGADFAIKRREDALIQIWDLAGQIGFEVLRRNYYQGANGALLVFDMKHPQSLDNIMKWLEEVHLSLGEMVPTILIGNKLDLLASDEELQSIEIKVQEKMEQIKQQYGIDMMYITTSALTGENIEFAFDLIISMITS